MPEMRNAGLGIWRRGKRFWSWERKGWDFFEDVFGASEIGGRLSFFTQAFLGRA